VCVVNHSIVAILDRSGTLDVANVGDCGLRILRNGMYATNFYLVMTCEFL
jgi:serine/threonine protein phosphatase PrpC